MQTHLKHNALCEIFMDKDSASVCFFLLLSKSKKVKKKGGILFGTIQCNTWIAGG